ncbi:MBL fold metallo-hydrolase [Thalassobacillus sp. CUG 92003]|uniref:MBL fold metallo-hydrolase n=1 Tax=Thalassobacillus sp. CUG 92003 TaxID=2736641 RepID=UPI0015E7CA50|nr:MBL fold metallo-hydrolase [Thalassobacillus sp. CUG 92003]
MDKDFEKHLQEDWHMGHAVTNDVLHDIAYYRTLIVNVGMIGAPDSEEWVLVDAGIENYAKRIIHAAENRFGEAPPRAIILTHGHFDHVGSADELAKHWNIPIYVHPDEMGYVNGTTDYPVGDSTVGGGLFALVSPFFPTKAVDLSDWIKPLPRDGTLPYLDDWKYIHTPGHTPGHISLFREKDKTLIAGDAFITVQQESSLAVFIQHQKVHGPPAYFTQDWHCAEQSVQTLAALQPEIAVTGHGLPMEGELLREQLDELAERFYELAIPKHKKQ